MNTVPNLRVWIRNVLRVQTAVDRSPGLACVVAPECAGGRNGDENPVRVAGIQDYGVQTHTSSAGLPFRSCAMAAQSREFLPRLTAVLRAKQSGVFHSRIDRVRIVKRWFDMPNALKLPRMLGAIVELMRGQRSAGFRGGVVHEFVALSLRRPSWRGLFARRRA